MDKNTGFLICAKFAHISRPLLQCKNATHANALIMNEDKYNQLKNFLTKGQYCDQANEQERYVLRKRAKNFRYDEQTNTLYHVDKKGEKKGLS